MSSVLASLKGGLIVSCQAPAHSPLHNAQIIAAFAQTALNNGAV
ncbi:MAG: N-acetylmannosamine-6-phosphate 2-epimerase, partial [Chloroflexaceae bacterium]|nr:N-acetylmannosamine-6-phosphate 2-epimerase [Chloroflexaceae bacterium]